MVVKRNWRDAAPRVGHESAIIWTLLAREGDPNVPPEVAPMMGQGTITLHAMQGRRSGDYHLHEDREQVYYFTQRPREDADRRPDVRRVRRRHRLRSRWRPAPARQRRR